MVGVHVLVIINFVVITKGRRAHLRSQRALHLGRDARRQMADRRAI